MQRNTFNFFPTQTDFPLKSKSSYVIFSMLDSADAKELLRLELIRLADNKELQETVKSRIWLLREGDTPCSIIVTWIDYDYNLHNPRNIHLIDFEKDTNKALVFTSQGWQFSENSKDQDVMYTLNHSSQLEVNNFNALNFLFELLEMQGFSRSLLVLPHFNLAAINYSGYCIQQEKSENEAKQLNTENNKMEIEKDEPSIKSLFLLQQILTCPCSLSLMVNAHTILINQFNNNVLLTIQNKLTEDQKGFFKNVMNYLANNTNLRLSQVTIELNVNAQQLTAFNAIANDSIKIIPNFLVQELTKILMNKELSYEKKLQAIYEEISCPITFDKLQSAYLLPSGKTCEEQIVKDIKAKNGLDPMSNMPLTDADLIPNNIISLFLDAFNKIENENNNAETTSNTQKAKLSF